MGFGFFKKKESVPPDVGNEINDSEEYETDDSQYVDGVTDATKPDIEPDINQVAPKGSSFAKPRNITPGVSISVDNLKLERLGARMESVDALLKGFSERFSMLSQQVGELRGMNLSNEKSIGKIATESSVAIDIVSELKPEKLIICGVLTDICVLHTTADARNRDYEVEVPVDCVASSDEAAHRFALEHMEKVLGAKLTSIGGIVK